MNNMKRRTTIAIFFTKKFTKIIAKIIATGLLAAGVTGCSLQNTTKEFNKLLVVIWGPQGTQLVDMAFHPNDADVRREGVVGLSDKDWAHNTPAIMKGIATILETDPAESVRCVAARALGKTGDPNYVAALAAALRDISPAVRWDAATALDNVVNESAVAPLRERAASDESADVRMACAKALRHYRITEAVAALVMCMDDDELGVRYVAHLSLVEIFARDMGADWQDWRGVVDKEIPPKIIEKPKRPWWKFFSTGAGDDDGDTPVVANGQE